MKLPNFWKTPIGDGWIGIGFTSLGAPCLKSLFETSIESMPC